MKKRKPWKIINKKVKHDPVIQHILRAYSEDPCKCIFPAPPEIKKRVSDILGQAGLSISDRILAGKNIIYIGPDTDTIDKSKQTTKEDAL